MIARKSPLIIILSLVLLPSTLMAQQARKAKTKAKGESKNGISWITKYNAARIQGTKSDKPVFLFITTDNCRHCLRMQKESFEDKQIASEIKKEFVPAKLHLKMDSKLAEDLRINIYPTTLIIAPDGKILDYARGYLSQAELTSRMNEAKKEMATARQKDAIAAASR